MTNITLKYESNCLWIVFPGSCNNGRDSNGKQSGLVAVGLSMLFLCPPPKIERSCSIFNKPKPEQEPLCRRFCHRVWRIDQIQATLNQPHFRTKFPWISNSRFWILYHPTSEPNFLGFQISDGLYVNQIHATPNHPTSEPNFLSFQISDSRFWILYQPKTHSLPNPISFIFLISYFIDQA